MNDPHPIHRVAPRSASGKAATEASSQPLRGAAPRLLNVGYGNLVTASRVVAIVAPAAAPMRRLRHEAGERGKLVDATEGRRTRSIVILDSDHVVLSAINPETLAARLVEDEPGSQP
ncbi:MAG: hypothetical protein H6Q91_50 [Deltaproteobacteria bacterium]|nr:hypothetical protein [Deltaproteobacteria bacterium]